MVDRCFVRVVFRSDDFFRIPELAINPLGERIVKSFFFFREDKYVEFYTLF